MYLELDVARATNVFFDQHTVVLERVLGLALRRIQHFREFLGGMDDAHALAAATVNGLDQHWDKIKGGDGEEGSDREKRSNQKNEYKL